MLLAEIGALHCLIVTLARRVLKVSGLKAAVEEEAGEDEDVVASQGSEPLAQGPCRVMELVLSKNVRQRIATDAKLR